MADTSPVKVNAKEHESYAAYTALAILIPIAGLLLGIIFMAKDDKLDRKLGEHMLAVSILFMIIYFVGLMIFVAMNAAATLN